MATLNTTFVSGINESIEGDVSAQVVLSFDIPPNDLTTIRITPSSADIDIGAGPGNDRIVFVGAGTTTITITAVNDTLVEGDETALLSFELGGTLDPNFTLDPVPDLQVRIVDSDANNAPESAFELLNEGFETDGNQFRYTTSAPEFSDGSEDFFGRTDGSNISGQYDVTGEVGSFFFAAQDIDQAIASGSQSNTQTLDFTGIDISGYENLVFSALFAEDDNGVFQSIDSADGLRVRAQIDGGGFFDVLAFEAGGDQGNEVAQLDTDFDGVGDGAALTEIFQRFSGAIAGTGSLLDIQIEFEASFGQEDFAIDDIRVTGDAVADLSVFATGFVDVFEGGQSDTIIARVSGTPDASDVIRTVVTWNPADYSVNGNATGSLTITALGSDFLADDDGELEQILTVTAINDAADELLDQGLSQYLTLDVQSPDDSAMDALGPVTVTGIRIWDNDGPTGADPDGAFLLHQEGFETDGAGIRYTLSRAELNNQNSIFGGDWFTRTTGGSDVENAGAGAETYGIIGGSEGSWFFSVQDPNGPTPGSNVESLTISGIDIEGFENLHLDLDLAEDDQDDGQQDYNASTFFSIEARIDGGAWVEVLRIEGTDQTDHEPGLDTDFDSERDGPSLQEQWQEFGADIAGTGDDLDLRFSFNDFLFSGEDISLDDIRVTGDAVADLSVFATGFVDVFEGGQSDTIIARVSGTPDASDVIRTVVTWNPADYSVNGNATGSLTITALGSDFLADDDGELEQILTVTAINDAADELLDQGLSQYLTLDVQSPDDSAMDALGPVTVTGIRIWDNDGPTGADPDGAFLLHQEGFETDGAGIRYTLSRAELNNQNSIFGGDWFTRTTGGSDVENAGAGAETYGIIGGSEGSWFFSVQDPNGPTPGSNVESLTISGIDIEGFENLHLDLDLAEDDQDDGQQDYNASTFFSIEARIDGGAWVEVLRIEGTDQTDHEPGLDTDFDSERDGPSLQEQWQEFGADIAGTGDDLDLRFSFNDFLFSGEDISLDDIRVTGDAVADLSVFATGFVDVFEGGQSDTIIARVSGTPDASDVIRTVVTWNPADYSVNGNATGSLTITALGSDFLADDDGELEQILTVTAINDAADELLDQGLSQYLTLDVQSPDDSAMDALGPVTVTGIRIWDNDGPTGADPDGAFLLHQEGFETDGAGIRYTLSRAELNNQNSIFGGDWFTRTTGGSDVENAGAGAETYGIIGGSEGSWFFSVQDPNGPTPGSNVESLTISGIDIEGFENLHLDLDLAEDDQDDGQQDYNASTFFSIEARIDGGAWVEVLRIEGTDQTDHEPGLDTDFDSERDGPSLQEQWQEFGADIAGTGDDLDLRFSFNDFLFSGEDISLDDIRVTGDAAGESFELMGTQVAGGNPIADSSFGGLDTVDDFSGNTSGTGFTFTFAGASSPEGFLLGDTVRVIASNAPGVVSFDAEGIVLSTNIDGGVLLIGGGGIQSEFGVPQIVILDSPTTSGAIQLEVGPSTPPLLLSSSPLDDATGVPTNGTIDLNFNENVIAGVGMIEIRRVSDDSVVQSFDVLNPEVSFAGSTVTISPPTALPPAEDLYVVIDPGAIRDLDGNPFAGIADNATLNFQTNLPPVAETSVILIGVNDSEMHVFEADDPENDGLSYSVNNPPSNGVLQILNNGTFTFTAPGTANTDSFLYNIDDGNGNVVTGNVDVTVHDNTGPQSVVGSNGNDLLSGSGFADDLSGGAGNDRLAGQNGDDHLEGGSGGDNLDGGIGSDTASYEGSDARVEINLISDTATGGHATGDELDSIENLIGSGFNDRLVGASGVNHFMGGDGNDNMNTSGGNDEIHGGNGNDLIGGGTGLDMLFGGADNDTIRGNGGADTIEGGIGEDDIFGGINDDVISAGDQNDEVLGQGGNDDINGDDGADVLRGGAGNDTIRGGTGNDQIFGNGNNDMLFGDAGNDTLQGAAGIDVLSGGANDDVLSGGTGADRLDGGTGNDTMNGGGADGARDVFVFGVGYENDRINAFDQAGTDRLELDDALWLAGHGVLTAQQVIDTFGSLNPTGTILTLDYGNGDILEVQNAATINATTLGSDVLIV